MGEKQLVRRALQLLLEYVELQRVLQRDPARTFSLRFEVKRKIYWFYDDVYFFYDFFSVLAFLGVVIVVWKFLRATP